MAVFSALKDVGPVAGFIADLAAFHDLLIGQTVAFYLLIIFSDSAVVAVIFTDVAELDDAADEDVLSVNFFTDAAGFFCQQAFCRIAHVIEQINIFFFLKRVFVFQFSDEVQKPAVRFPKLPGGLLRS